MPDKKCSVNGCDRPSSVKGLCKMHYARMWRTGTTFGRGYKRTLPCTVPGCDRKIRCKGLCEYHYTNLLHHGSPYTPYQYDFIRRDHYETYKIWKGMRDRCNRPKNRRYKDYGGRGIKVCDRWNGPHGAKHFYEDMGERPSKEHSIDRIDVNGDYEPSNCRWATSKVQANNRRPRTKK